MGFVDLHCHLLWDLDDGCRSPAETLEAARALAAADEDGGGGASAAERKRRVIAALDEVAARLGNTRAVCRTSYVDPLVVNAFLDGHTIAAMRGRARAPAALEPDERALLGLLDARWVTKKPGFRRSSAETRFRARSEETGFPSQLRGNPVS